MPQITRVVVLTALTALLGIACAPKNKLEKCHKPQEYPKARPGPRLRIPGELEALPSEVRLPVPYGETRTESTPKNEPCLVEPPDFKDRTP
ncbi:MAG: hypothetical protein ACR2QG_13435 [Gammaproteobacteria bacterium]